jgi:type II secretory pathway component PulC
MSDDEIRPAVNPKVHEAIKDATFAELSTNLSSVIESRLSEFKRYLTDNQYASASSAVKRVKRSEVGFKSKGNRKQYEHQQDVLDSLTEAKEALEKAKYDKAKKAIQEGISLTEKRIKVIKLADRSEFGWSTILSGHPSHSKV